MSEVRLLKLEQCSSTALRGRRQVWVDACEVGSLDGCLTIRAGSLQTEPLLVALPAHAAESLPDIMLTASLDAEETYWDVVCPLVAEASDAEAANAAVSRWVLGQDWSSGLTPLIQSDEDIFLVAQFGFVGLVLGPPFTPEPVLAIFDPLQLRRLDSTFRQLIADAMSSSHPIWSTATVDQALRTLAARPWASQPRDEPSAEQARSEMRHRRIQFLARTPRLPGHGERT